MGSVSTIYNGVRQKLAGRALMDVAFSSTSTNGVQNKVIKARLDEIESEIPHQKILASVTADGVKTNLALLNQLGNTIDFSKLKIGVSCLHVKEPNNYEYEAKLEQYITMNQTAYFSIPLATLRQITLQKNGTSSIGHISLATGSAWIDDSNTVPTSGTIYTVYG